MKRTLLLSLLLLAPAAWGQTYTPKTIRLEGVTDADRPEVMQRLGLPEHVPLTKQQIEDGMGRLANTGNYTDLSYTVNGEALVITLKSAAGTTQAMPVTFENLVWWQPEELEKLLEARVPLYHGQLPLTGSLTDEVRAALTRLLVEKNIQGAQVEVTMEQGTLALAVTEPKVLVGKVTLPGTGPEAAAQMDKVIARLEGREFDRLETLATVRNNALDTHRNAGYLDVAVEPTTVSGPRQEGKDYVVDVSAQVHPQGLYHVASLSVDPMTGDAAGLKPADILKATDIKAGDVAGAMTLAIGVGLGEREVRNHGLLEGKLAPQVTKDTGTSKVVYRFVCTPGPIYTVDHIDVSALPPAIGAHVLQVAGVQPGVRADADATGRVMRGLQSEHLLPGASINLRLNRAAHTAVYVVQVQRSPGR